VILLQAYKNFSKKPIEAKYRYVFPLAADMICTSYNARFGLKKSPAMRMVRAIIMLMFTKCLKWLFFVQVT